MNKTPFDKVKAKCKDTGLSEKYLKAITEKMGGSIADDSADEAAIEAAANQIAEIANATQGEATRWAAKKNEEKNDQKKETKDTKETKKETEEKNPLEDKIAAMEKELSEMKAKEAGNARNSAIQAAIKKHKIPEWRTKGLYVPDDADPDAFMAEIHQDLVTQNLVPADAEGKKVANEKAIDEASNDLLESITVKN